MKPSKYYKYVEGEDVTEDFQNGDLDRISYVPRGKGEEFLDTNLVRGEPIVYLMDHLRSLSSNNIIKNYRYYNSGEVVTYENQTTRSQFSRAISARQMNAIRDTFQDLIPRICKSSEASMIEADDNLGTYLDADESIRENPSVFNAYDMQEFLTYQPIDRRRIDGLISDVKALYGGHILVTGLNPISFIGYRGWSESTSDCTCTKVSGKKDRPRSESMLPPGYTTEGNTVFLVEPKTQISELFSFYRFNTEESRGVIGATILFLVSASGRDASSGEPTTRYAWVPSNMVYGSNFRWILRGNSSPFSGLTNRLSGLLRLKIPSDDDNFNLTWSIVKIELIVKPDPEDITSNP